VASRYVESAGDMLGEEFRPDNGRTVTGLAAAIGVSRQTINALLR